MANNGGSHIKVPFDEKFPVLVSSADSVIRASDKYLNQESRTVYGMSIIHLQRCNNLLQVLLEVNKLDVLKHYFDDEKLRELIKLVEEKVTALQNAKEYLEIAELAAKVQLKTN